MPHVADYQLEWSMDYLTRYAESKGRADADIDMQKAEARANAKAAVLLAASSCPEAVINWAAIHGIANFAEFTWQAGFIAGMKMAQI